MVVNMPTNVPLAEHADKNEKCFILASVQERMRDRWKRCSSLLLSRCLIATTRQQSADVRLDFIYWSIVVDSLRVNSKLSTSCYRVVTGCN